jgi:hypothetical protein
MPASQHYFYNIMRKTIIQFLDMFNDIAIARFNPDTGAVTKYVDVPLKFAPKTKQWYWTELKEARDRRDTVLPIMAIDLDNVEYAQDRQVNRNHKISLSDNGDIKQYFNPVPYDFIFNLQIAAEYMVDITQIVEQIFPFFTPEAYIRITVPELNIQGVDGEMDKVGSDSLELKVVYESASKEAPVELDEAGYRILIWKLTFRVKGYLMSPMFETKRVHHVVQNYYLTDDAFDKRDQDVDDGIGVRGNRGLQGDTYATDIPDDDTPIDDTIRNLYKYEQTVEP